MNSKTESNITKMQRIKTKSNCILLMMLFILSSCGTSDISNVSNKIPIEIRTIGTIEEEDAKKEINLLLKGIKFAGEFFVPIIDVTDMTFNTDSTKLKTSQIKVPLSSIDAASIGFTDDILDQSTYQDNLDDSEIEKDSAYQNGIRILCSQRGNFVKRRLMPSDPIKPNEFFLTNAINAKTDTAKHFFRSTEDLLTFLNESKKSYNKLVLFYMGDKNPISLKDTDKDGLSDEIDKCLGIQGPKECMGCPCESSIAKEPVKQKRSIQSQAATPSNNCGSCKQKFNIQINAVNNSLSWNSCPSARFIYVDVASSSGKFQKSYKLNGSSTSYTIPLGSESVIKNNPSIPLHDKFTITVKAECGSGKIIQSESKSKIKLKCN